MALREDISLRPTKRFATLAVGDLEVPKCDLDVPECALADRSLRWCALSVLSTSDPSIKAVLTRDYATWWQSTTAQITGAADASIQAPDSPARLCKEGRRGTTRQRGAKCFLNSVTHAEGCAIDCFWDLIARFGPEFDRRFGASARPFCGDVVRIACEEATHFERLRDRLSAQHGVNYGDLDCNDTLATSMTDTRDSLDARMAIVHLVHEARGLDVFEAGQAKLRRSGDSVTADTMRRNFEDEIGHVRVMRGWFEKLHADQPAALQAFHGFVRDKKRWSAMSLKGPFNDDARTAAGLDEAWYGPVAESVPSI
ncbi:hypothetical protein M885DRAFT_620017 [Pelagophyceae sp. CCMP2097]|nr:hypothetical protein M885DRAFT_620017 [Pelagophyceae sp. CCMP2097]